MDAPLDISRRDGALLTCRDLHVGHGGRALLPPIELSIRPGELWAVIGRNGSGKTTWLRTLLGLLPPVAGSVLQGQSGLKLSYLPQRQAFDELYPLLARDIVGMGLDRGRAALFWPGRDARARIAAALALVGAADLGERPFRQLSEGQKQRVLFARVAAAEPDVAVLDDPTSAMDLVAERAAYELLKRLQRERRLALIVVSHFLGLARKYADRALLLDRDTPAVVSGTPDEVLAHSAFQKRYGDPLSELEVR
jgi:zinc transport system ATP-binding protein